MDCPNCGAYNASNSFRCRRCDHVLPSRDDDSNVSEPESDWGPASDPAGDRWDEHFRSSSSHIPDESEDQEPEWSDPWTTPEPEPSQPSDWDIAQPSSSDSWGTGSSEQSTIGPAPGGATTYGGGIDVPNYLWPSIGATLCCCAPLGIPAIVFASRVDAYKASGDRAAAEEASNKAKMWALAAFGVSILFWIAIFCTGAFTGESPA